MNPEIEQLKKELQELKRWKEEKDRQFISYPLDQHSVEVLNKYFLRIVDEYVYFGGASDNSFPTYVVKQDNKIFDVPTNLLIQYVANPDTDIISIVNKARFNNFADGATIVLYTTDTTPGGLNGQGLTTYYVVNAASDGFSFKVSTTQGGAAVNITSTGSGKQFLARI